jgi:hypothetical protein
MTMRAIGRYRHVYHIVLYNIDDDRANRHPGQVTGVYDIKWPSFLSFGWVQPKPLNPDRPPGQISQFRSRGQSRYALKLKRRTVQ